MHPLDGSLLKVGRAKSEVKRLRVVEDAYRRNADYRIAKAEFNHKTGRQVYRVVAGPLPEPEWGIYIGEIAHNLRSALDGLIYQLVLLNRKAPTNNTQFPIFLVGHTIRRRRGRGKQLLIPHFEGMELADGRRMIQGVRDDHQARLERLQPYKRGHDRFVGSGRNNVLYLLKELNNADKHRLIQVVGAKAGSFWVASWGDTDPFDDEVSHGRFVVLEDGAKFLEATPRMLVDTEITPLISFWRGCEAVQHKGVVFTLYRMATHVESILADFWDAFI